MSRIVGFYNFDYLDKVSCALFTPDGHLLKVNKSFKTLTGTAKRGRHVFDIFPDIPADRYEKGLTKRGRFNHLTTLEVRGREFDLQLAFRNIERRGTEYIFLQINDRTRDREKDAILSRATQLLEKRNRELDTLNRDLNEAYDQLVLSGKLTAVGEMATSMILEMRHPLELMMVNAQMLDDHIRDREATEMLQAIIQAGAQVNKIVEGLRGIAQKGGRPNTETLSVKDLIDDTAKLFRKQVQQRKIDLQIDKIDPELKIDCRPTEITQVFLNLLSNAADAVEDYDTRWIRLEAVQQDSDVAISFVDSGTGLPAELVPKLMEPFFTTKAAGTGTGTGLGLSISKKILEAHKGSLSVNHDRENTCFVATLPLSEGQDEAS